MRKRIIVSNEIPLGRPSPFDGNRDIPLHFNPISVRQQIRDFGCTKDRLSKKREEYAELQQKCTEERKKMEADKEMQISSLAERTSEEIKSVLQVIVQTV